MMGQQPRTESLFYYFRLEDQIPCLEGTTLIVNQIVAHRPELVMAVSGRRGRIQ